MELGSYMFKLHDPWLGFSSAAPMKTLGLSPIDYFTQELNHHIKEKKTASFDTEFAEALLCSCRGKAALLQRCAAMFVLGEV